MFFKGFGKLLTFSLAAFGGFFKNVLQKVPPLRGDFA